MARSIDQQIAEAQSRLNKLKDRGRYILASLSLAAARNDPAPACSGLHDRTVRNLLLPVLMRSLFVSCSHAMVAKIVPGLPRT